MQPSAIRLAGSERMRGLADLSWSGSERSERSDGISFISRWTKKRIAMGSLELDRPDG